MIDLVRGVGVVLSSSWRASAYRLVVSATLMLLGGISGPLVALSLGIIVNATVRGDVGTATTFGAAVALLVLLSLTMEHFAHIFFLELAALHQIELERELGRMVQGTIGMELHERQDLADRMQLLRKETPSIGEGVQTVLAALTLLVQITLTAVLLARIEAWLLVLPLFAIPPLLAGRFADARLERAEMRTAEATRLGWHLQQVAIGAAAAKEVRIFGLQDHLRNRLRATLSEVDRALRGPELIGLAARAAGQLIYAAGYVGAVILVVRAAIAGQRSVGDVVLLIALAVQTNALAAAAVAIAKALQRNARALSWLRVLRIETQQSIPVPGTGLDPPARIRNGIQLDRVSFRYAGSTKDALSDVTLFVPAGSTVAIVGDNGAGKSTLVKLLCRFYEPTQGRIMVDDLDLSDLDVGRWRERASAGFQDFARLNTPAWESIGVGDLTRIDSRDSISAAVHRADADEVIRSLPNGLDSMLGKSHDDGEELSGGQWQRVALSRAMMRPEPLLLVLDEPTAALDPLTEHALFERYAAAAHEAGLRTGGITILISHRFSTVRMADLILVVSDGRIAEAGDHQTLMRHGGIYAELFTLQADAYR